MMTTSDSDILYSSSPKPIKLDLDSKLISWIKKWVGNRNHQHILIENIVYRRKLVDIAKDLNSTMKSMTALKHKAIKRLKGNRQAKIELEYIFLDV